VAAHPKDVILRDAQFTVQNAIFDYEAVASIRFQYTAIKLMAAGLVHQGTVHHPELDIYIRNQERPLKIKLPWGFVANPVTHTKKKADELIAVYDELSRRTFSVRAHRYLHQIEKEHYFIYDNKTFTTDGQVLTNAGSLLFVIFDVQLLKYPFEVRCVAKGNMLEKASRMFTRSHVIKTEYDRDVFFALLDQMYNIRWP
jgi:hypothetical protein